MSDELKPCPFCGGEAELVEFGNNIKEKYVACSNCFIATDLCDEPIAAWNRRAIDSDEEVNAAYMHGFQNGKDAVFVPTPEPMTSVVRWTRYNGTEETLPPIGKRVLLKDGDSFAYIPLRGNMRRGDKWFFEDDTQREIEIGDEWTYWPPQPPEGSE